MLTITRRQLEQLAAAMEGVPVWGCIPGSTGSDAGIRYGDIVLAANGLRTTGVEDYVTAKALRDDGIELLIFRDGRELTVFVPYLAVTDAAQAAQDTLGEAGERDPFGPNEPNESLPN